MDIKLPFAKFSIEFSRIHPEITCSAFSYRRRKLNEGSRPRPRPRFRRCKARRGSGCSSAVRHEKAIAKPSPFWSNKAKQIKSRKVILFIFSTSLHLSNLTKPSASTLRLRISQAKSPLEPLFLDHAGNPVSRTWFQNSSNPSCYQQVSQQQIFPATPFASGQRHQRPKKASLNTKSKPQVDGLQKLFKATSERTSSTSNQPTKLSFHKKPGASFPGFFLPVQITRLARLPLLTPRTTTSGQSLPAKKLAFSTLRPESLTHLGCELPSPARWRRVPPGYPTLPFRLYLSDSES